VIMKTGEDNHRCSLGKPNAMLRVARADSPGPRRRQQIVSGWQRSRLRVESRKKDRNFVGRGCNSFGWHHRRWWSLGTRSFPAKNLRRRHLTDSLAPIQNSPGAIRPDSRRGAESFFLGHFQVPSLHVKLTFVFCVESVASIKYDSL
jgi:hypothetical protein